MINDNFLGCLSLITYHLPITHPVHKASKKRKIKNTSVYKQPTYPPQNTGQQK